MDKRVNDKNAAHSETLRRIKERKKERRCIHEAIRTRFWLVGASTVQSEGATTVNN
jgi:hypothetical protein